MNMSFARSFQASESQILAGSLLAIFGNVLISVSFQIQRLVHRDNEGGAHYTKIPKWWIGLICMGSGEIGNFLAYGLAPASMVSPLGAITGKFLSCNYKLF